MQTSAGALLAVIAVLVGTAFGVVFLLAGSMTSPTPLPPSATVPARPSAPASVVDQAPVATQPPPATPTTQSAPRVNVIAGLAPVDVTVNLRNKGLECSGIRPGKELHSWHCKSTPAEGGGFFEHSVEVWGPSTAAVSSVNATVLQYARPSDDLAGTFLGYVATLPYEGALPAEARRWVEENVSRVDTGKPATTTIGAATFALVGPKTGRFLQITPKKG